MARGAARRGTRPKGDNITFPLEAWGVESINKNFDALFKDLHSTSVGQLLDGEHIDTADAAAEVGALIYGTNTTPSLWDILSIGAADTVLRTEGTIPEWNKVHLTTDVDEILPVANGGTNVGTYTAGSVIFAGAGGLLLTEDNANFFWNDTDNRLGLGTAVPTVRFDLVLDGGGTALALGARLANTTAATAGATRQYAPALVFSGTGWDTDGAGASKTMRQAWQLRTISGTSPQSAMYVGVDSDGAGTFQDEFVIGTIAVGDSPRVGIRDGNLVFRNAGRGIAFIANPLTDTTSAALAVFSGDVVGGTVNRIKTSIVGGYFFVEGNNFGFAAGAQPSMDFRNFDASTNTPIIGIRHRATPGGVVANGFGVRQLYQANSSTTADQDQGAFDIVWSDVTHATRSADFVISLVDAAAAIAEKFRFASTGLATIPSLNLTSGALGNADGTTYTPTRSAETNLDANVTVTQAQYVRLRNSVTVSGRFTADPTAAATPTSFELTLPIASNIGAAEDVAGVAFCGSIAGQGAEITGSVANNTAVVSWISGDVTSQTWSYTFTYQVI